MKNGRWVRIHEQGQENFEAKNNVIDIVAGSPRCQAEATFTSTRTFAKAAYWLLRYLGHADAQQLLVLAAEEIRAKAAEAAKDDSRMDAAGEGWNCNIEKMGAGEFKVSMSWTPDIQPVEIAAKERSKKTDEAQSVEIAAKETDEAQPVETTTKKRNRKKKTVETQSVEEITVEQPVETTTKKRNRKTGKGAKGLLGIFPKLGITVPSEA